MAIWQFKLDLLPQEAVIEQYGAIPLTIHEDAMNQVNWWGTHQPPKELCAWIAGLLPEAPSWSESNLFYECCVCGDTIPSTPKKKVCCKCGNIVVDAGSRRIEIRDCAKAKLFLVTASCR